RRRATFLCSDYQEVRERIRRSLVSHCCVPGACLKAGLLRIDISAAGPFHRVATHKCLLPRTRGTVAERPDEGVFEKGRVHEQPSLPSHNAVNIFRRKMPPLLVAEVVRLPTVIPPDFRIL